MARKYKIGDEVLLRVKIVDVSSSAYAYSVRTSDSEWRFRAMDDDIEGIAPARNTKVGDFVLSSRGEYAGMIGKIVADDGSITPYIVEFANYDKEWHKAGQVTLAKKPDDWDSRPARMKEGDRVNAGKYGKGTIERDDGGMAPFLVKFDGGGTRWFQPSDLTRIAKSTRRPTKGDRVMYRGNAGTITEDDGTDIPYRVTYDDRTVSGGGYDWAKVSQVTLIEPEDECDNAQTADRFARGDKVVHTGRGFWGIGEVIEKSSSTAAHDYNRSSEYVQMKGVFYTVKYPFRENGGLWCTHESNLKKVE